MPILTKVARRLSFIVGLGFPALHWMYKEKEISNFRPDMELKINNKAVPIPEKLQTLVDEVVKEMGTNTQEVPEVTAFICKGNDVKHTDRTWRSTHIFLGIPYHYIHDDSSQFSVVTDGQEVTKDKPDYILLKDSMCLSREAKKYSIANALYEGIDETFLYVMLLTPMVMFKCTCVSFVLDFARKRVRKKLLPFRYHGMAYLAGIWTLITINDLCSVWKEARAAVLPADLGESYMKGGLEYYNKILERNKLIRIIDKSSPYNKSGEVRVLPIGICRMRFNTKLEYLKSISEGEETSVWKYILLYY